MHVWQTAVTEFLVFVSVPFVVAACDDFFMSKTADLRIGADGLEHDGLAKWAYSQSLVRRSLTLCRHISHSVLGKRSIGLWLTSNIHPFCIDSVGRR